MKIYLAQLHCPSSHCILAVAAGPELQEGDETAFMLELGEALKGGAVRAMKDGKIDPWCGICGAEPKEWTVYVDLTKYTSMEEATPALREHERIQCEAVERLHAARRRAARQ